MNNLHIDAEQVKPAAAGRELELLEYVAYLDRDVLDGKPHPCPKCGGTDRFRLIDAKAGAVFCNQCFSSKNGDFLAAIQHFRGISFPQTLEECAYRLGLTPSLGGNGNDKPKLTTGAPSGSSQEGSPSAADPLQRMAETKRCPVESLRVYGGTTLTKDACAFPEYGPDMKGCSQFNVWPDGKTDQQRKGMNARNKPAGLFFPHDASGNVRPPQPGETWLLVEGVKDASALHGLGYPNVCGLNTSSLSQKFAKLFAGLHIIVIPDPDEAGDKGAAKTVRTLQGVAASVKVANLPVRSKDVRDHLALDGGEQMVRDAIENAGQEGEAEPPAFAKLIELDDFLQMQFADDELIPGVLVGGQPGVIGARLKCMKTHMAAELAVSLASKTPFCGHFPVSRECRVGLWSGESGRKKVQRILKAQREAHGITGRIPLFVNFSLPKLSLSEHLDVLHDVITKNKLDVCEFDPLYMALLDASTASLAGNLYAMGAILEPLSKLGQDTNCTMLVCHHFRKTAAVDQDEPCSLEELSQAGVAEWAGQWLLLARRTPYQSDGRHELFMRVGGRAGHASFWALDIDEGHPAEGPDGQKWEIGIRPISDARAEAKAAADDRKAKARESRDNEDRRKMLESIRRCPEGETQKELSKLSGISNERGATAVRTLLGEGKINRIEIKKNKRSENGYVATGK